MRKSLYIVVFLLIGFNIEIKAQPPDPPDGPGCFPPPCVPIDGGLSWLLIAGAVYGGKKVFELNTEDLDKKVDN